MSEIKHFVVSGIMSLGFSVFLCAAVIVTDKTERTTTLGNVIQKTNYLSDQAMMDREMAEILLPRLQAQQDEKIKRGEIKKPDMVFVPEQLQQSRGY